MFSLSVSSLGESFPWKQAVDVFTTRNCRLTFTHDGSMWSTCTWLVLASVLLLLAVSSFWLSAAH